MENRYTVYRYHDCEQQHRTFRATARCIWGSRLIPAATATGSVDGPWFCVGRDAVTQHASYEQAAAYDSGARVVFIADDCAPRFAPETIAAAVGNPPMPARFAPPKRVEGGTPPAMAFAGLLVLLGVFVLCVAILS